MVTHILISNIRNNIQIHNSSALKKYLYIFPDVRNENMVNHIKYNSRTNLMQLIGSMSDWQITLFVKDPIVVLSPIPVCVASIISIPTAVMSTECFLIQSALTSQTIQGSVLGEEFSFCNKRFLSCKTLSQCYLIRNIIL